MTPIELVILYIAFRFKHFACDFLLQTDWMALTKGKPGREGYKALFTHTFIHALGTFAIVMVFAPSLWWLGLVDFVIHSIVDRMKGKITLRENWTPKDTLFWWAFGLDQELHNLTHLGYIVLIFISLGGLLQ